MYLIRNCILKLVQFFQPRSQPFWARQALMSRQGTPVSQAVPLFPGMEPKIFQGINSFRSNLWDKHTWNIWNIHYVQILDWMNLRSSRQFSIASQSGPDPLIVKSWSSCQLLHYRMVNNSSVILFQVTVALAVALGNFRSRDHDHCLDIG